MIVTERSTNTITPVSTLLQRASKSTNITSNMDYEEWKNLPLKDKFQATIEGYTIKNQTTRMLSRLGPLVFWYTSLTIIYCTLVHIIPEYCTGSGPTTMYYYKVGAVFLMIQTCANWCCTFFYSSANRKTRDNGGTEPDLVLKRSASPLPTHVNGSVTQDSLNARIWEDTNSDRTGLVWGYCSACDIQKPPRTHHCPVCDCCVLKRDHHCFFTHSCIGYYNQRYFTVLCFYIALSTTVAVLLDWSYLAWKLDPEISLWAYFLPNTIYHWWYDEFPVQCLIMITHFYVCLWATPMAGGFFVTQMLAIYWGKTTHELFKQERIRCLAKPADNFRDVFGAFWPINFLFPAVLVYRQDGDGKHWKYIKKY